MADVSLLVILSLAAVGMCPVFILPVTDFIVFAKHISKVVPLFRAMGLINVLPRSALPFSLLLNDKRQDTILKLLDCFVSGNYSVKVARHYLILIKKVAVN